MDNVKRKEIISNAIHSAICIDDEYLEPYMVEEGKLSAEPKALYDSFKNEGHCALDVHCYKDFETYVAKKNILLNGKDMMVLDWELTRTEPKYFDALHILDDVISNDLLSFIVVYTSSPDYKDIAAKIVTSFLRLKTDTYNLEDIEDKILKYALDNDIDIKDESVFPADSSSGYTLNPGSRKDIRGKIFDPIIKKFGTNINSILTKYIQDENFLIWLDTKESNITDVVASLKSYNVQPIDENAIKVNGTLILVLPKKKDANDLAGIKADKVYEMIVSSVQSIENKYSFLFSMMMRNVIDKELTKFGVGLASISDKTIIHHAKTYESNDGLIDYIGKCTANYILDVIKRQITPDAIKDIFKSDKETNYDNDELIRLNKLLTFTDKIQMKGENKKIMTGDVFHLNAPFCKFEIDGDTRDCDYLICVSQSCDCERPDDKINFNYAFAIGAAVPDKSKKKMLGKVETSYLSFVGSNTVVMWSPRFITIHIEHSHEFALNTPIGVVLNDNKGFNMKYIGNQKEFFTQRVVNEVFNYAMRIGVDLPHIKK